MTDVQPGRVSGFSGTGAAGNFDGGDPDLARSGRASASAARTVRAVSPRLSAGHSGRRAKTAQSNRSGAAAPGRFGAQAAGAGGYYVVSYLLWDGGHAEKEKVSVVFTPPPREARKSALDADNGEAQAPRMITDEN